MPILAVCMAASLRSKDVSARLTLLVTQQFPAVYMVQVIHYWASVANSLSKPKTEPSSTHMNLH